MNKLCSWQYGTPKDGRGKGKGGDKNAVKSAGKTGKGEGKPPRTKILCLNTWCGHMNPGGTSHCEKCGKWIPKPPKEDSGEEMGKTGKGKGGQEAKGKGDRVWERTGEWDIMTQEKKEETEREKDMQEKNGEKDEDMKSDCGRSTGSDSEDEGGDLTLMEVMKERLKQAEEQRDKARKQNKTGKWVTEIEKHIERMKRTIREGPKRDIKEIERFLAQNNEQHLVKMADWEKKKQETNEAKDRIKEQQTQNADFLKKEYEMNLEMLKEETQKREE